MAAAQREKGKLFCWYYKVLGLKLEDEGEGFRHICVYSFVPCTSIPSAVHVFFIEIWDLRPWYISNHWNLRGKKRPLTWKSAAIWRHALSTVVTSPFPVSLCLMLVFEPAVLPYPSCLLKFTVCLWSSETCRASIRLLETSRCSTADALGRVSCRRSREPDLKRSISDLQCSELIFTALCSQMFFPLWFSLFSLIQPSWRE